MHHMKGFIMSTFLADDIDLYHLVKVVSVDFSAASYYFPIFPLVINMYLERENNYKNMHMSFTLQCVPSSYIC